MLRHFVQTHSSTLSDHSNRISEQNSQLMSFKGEMKSAISETKNNIKDVAAEMADLPNTISISTKQVYNRIEEDEEECDTSPVEESLQSILNDQEQKSLLHEEHVNRLEEKLALHAEGMEVMREGFNGNIENIQKDIKSVIDWKDEQSSVDLVELKQSQDSVLSSFGDMKNELEHKMSRQDVDTKLNAKVDEIVDHMQNALLSVEEDEADFKAVTDALKKMCDTLKENKADKSDIALLRTQFIQNEVDGSSNIPASGGSTLDNEGIRNILAHYPTAVSVERRLDEKTDKDSVIPRLDRTDAVIHGIQSTLEQLLHMMRAGYNAEEVMNSEQRPRTAPSAYGPPCPPEIIGRNRINMRDDDKNEQGDRSEDVMEAWSEASINDEVELVLHKQSKSLHEREGGKQSQQHHQATSINSIAKNIDQDFLVFTTTAIDNTAASLTDEDKGPLRVIQQDTKPNTTNGRQSVYSSSILELTGGCRVGENRNKNEKCFPLINRDRAKLNPGSSYGGGFQIVGPSSSSSSSLQARKQHPQEKQGRLRAIDQYKSVLPIIETKLMVAGSDGKFYVSRRQSGGAGVRGGSAAQGFDTQKEKPSHLANRTKIV